ncbi:unnamed protein product [Coffea canephora]|uniref:Uncharacterized protein n=1 Tax=Coffea canephora TaxID=49390 RepID=A0A068V1D9_COFCA|nr:unnamed protein product [Coffea canephora]
MQIMILSSFKSELVDATEMGSELSKTALYSKGVSIVDTEKASKQWLQSCGVSTETRKSRIVRWLHSHGFS